MLECSVIILNWNGEAMLRRYLPSVIQYTQLEGVEIVVADNGSTDASLEFLHSQPVRIIELGENLGFAEGYNRAIEQVESKYVVLLNSDVEVTSNWLDTLLNYARAHEDVVAIQPKILSWQSKEDAIKAYAIADGSLRKFDLTLGSLTDDERQIILDGCLINYNRVS
jgi:GT2 family glycosyltransferase